MADLMSYKDVIKKIKEKSKATDEEIQKNADEIEKKYSAIIKTKDFLYYLVAEQKYSIRLPKITGITSNGQSDKDPIALELHELTSERADSLMKNKQPINVEGYIFDQKKTPTQKGSEKYNFTIVSNSGCARGLTSGDDATQIWEDADVRPGSFVKIVNASVFMPSPKSVPRISVSRYSNVETLLKDKDMYSVICNVAENYAKNGDLVYAEGYVSDSQKSKEYKGCPKCFTKRMKKGKMLVKCPKCSNQEDAVNLFFERVSVYDGSVSIVVSLSPTFTQKGESFLSKFIRFYGIWKEDKKEMTYMRHEVLDGKSGKVTESKTKPKEERVKEVEKDIKSGQTKLTKPDSKITDDQKRVFVGVVKNFGRATVDIVVKHLMEDIGVKNEKEAKKIISNAVDAGLVNYIKEDKSGLEWNE